jgi:hypothetical protein
VEPIVIIIVAMVVLVTIFLAVGNKMRNSWRVERAVLVNTTASELFELINDLSQWQKWTVWNNQNEPDLQFEYPTQKKSGLNALQSWTSPRLKGELTITKSTKNNEIAYTFALHRGNFRLNGLIALGAADTYFTQVAWRLELAPIASINPMQRYLGGSLRQSFDTDIEESLQNLVALFEGSHPTEEIENEADDQTDDRP